MRVSVAVVLVAMLAACSTAGTEGVPADIAVSLASPLFFGADSRSNADFDVTITNRATVPVRIRRVSIASGAVIQYVITPLERSFDEPLAPGQSKTVRLATEAIASVAGVNPAEPMRVRIVAELETPDGSRVRKIANILNVAP
jgi:hypothetical protein